MKALTVQQPWAWAIFNGKDVENRSQLWHYRGILAIHAGVRVAPAGMADARILHAASTQLLGAAVQEDDSALRALRSSLEFGAVLGVVEVVDIHYTEGCCPPWGEKEYIEHGGRSRRDVVHIVLENPRLLPDPVPCRGALGLWNLPADIAAKCRPEDA